VVHLILLSQQKFYSFYHGNPMNTIRRLSGLDAIVYA